MLIETRNTRARFLRDADRNARHSRAFPEGSGGVQVQNQPAPSTITFEVPPRQPSSSRPLYEQDPLYLPRQTREGRAQTREGRAQISSVPSGLSGLPQWTNPIVPTTPANLSAGISGQAGTSTQGPVFHVTMKPREPPVFSGKSHEDIENWIYTVSAYFRTVAAPEAQKVGYALTFLQDAAREWWIGTIRSTGREPGTWQELADALRARFGHRTKEMTARAELRVIKQQKGESVRVYAARFNRLLGHLPGFDEAWAKDQFSSGLMPRVAELLLFKSPRSLQDFMVEAERVEVTLKYAQHTRASKAQN